jgi:hypothetical protein
MALVLGVTLSGCREVTFHHNDSRFVHTQQDPTPDRRPHYPNELDAHIAAAVDACDDLGTPIAGIDILLEYREQSGSVDADERFIQQVTAVGTVGVTTAASTAFGDQVQTVDEEVIEMFRPDGASAFDLIARHICHEGTMDLRFEGEVGIMT